MGFTFYWNYIKPANHQSTYTGIFSDQTLNELNTAMEDIHIPDEDTFIECNELLQDLSVNYRKEGLYTAFLQPVLTEACRYSNIYSQSDNNSISRTLQTSQKQFCSMLTDYDIVFAIIWQTSCFPT